MKSPAVEQFWTNAIDSIRHALDHFAELSTARPHLDQTHDKKWIVISTALATEAFFKAALLEDGKKIDNAKGRYIPMETAINALKASQLPTSESLLIRIAEKVSKQRDEILHRPHDPKMELSYSAILILGLLEMIKRRLGNRPSAIVTECQELGETIVSKIEISFLDEHEKIISQFLSENYSDQFFEPCPYCGAHSVVDGGVECVVCYADLSRSECDRCGYDRLYPSYLGDPGCEVCSQQSVAKE
ncbi:MAG: hypothetical protein ACR2RF_24430 [Geminicoccaceae bacterium]